MGLVVDVALEVLPGWTDLVVRVAVFAAAMMMIAVGTGLYVDASYGPGPRVVGQFESGDLDGERTPVGRWAQLDRSRKRPRDVNSLAASIVRDATDEDKTEPADDGKDPAAVALGRKGGLKGGAARAAKLTPEQRSEIARRAAQRRWSKVRLRGGGEGV